MRKGRGTKEQEVSDYEGGVWWVCWFSVFCMPLTLSCWISNLCWFSWLLRRLFSWWRLSMVWLCCTVIWMLLSICNLKISIVFSWSSSFSFSVSLSTCRVWHWLWASFNLARCWKNQLCSVSMSHYNDRDSYIISTVCFKNLWLVIYDLWKSIPTHTCTHFLCFITCWASCCLSRSSLFFSSRSSRDILPSWVLCSSRASRQVFSSPPLRSCSLAASSCLLRAFTSSWSLHCICLLHL